MNLLRKQLLDALDVKAVDDAAFRGVFELEPSFVGFQGHFPEEPVMPGISLVAMVLLAAESVAKTPLEMVRLKAAKFYSPVRPGDRVTIEGDLDRNGDGWAVTAALQCEDRKVASVQVEAAERT